MHPDAVAVNVTLVPIGIPVTAVEPTVPTDEVILTLFGLLIETL